MCYVIVFCASFKNRCLYDVQPMDVPPYSLQTHPRSKLKVKWNLICPRKASKQSSNLLIRKETFFPPSSWSTSFGYWESWGVPTIVPWLLGVLHCWKARIKAFIDPFQGHRIRRFPSIFEWILIFVNHPDGTCTFFLVFPMFPHVFFGAVFLSQSEDITDISRGTSARWTVAPSATWW